jgi:hypothetical protein
LPTSGENIITQNIMAVENCAPNLKLALKYFALAN